MRRYFNTEGLCNLKEHYMVRLDERLDKIKRLFIDRGKYFVINRGRQYGKTTTLRALAGYLREEYIVCSMDFQMISTEEFRNEDVFSRIFAKSLMEGLEDSMITDYAEAVRPLIDFTKQDKKRFLRELFVKISTFCGAMPKPVVLIIDEVDSASNNQVFLDFLAQLRGYYLTRGNKPAFQSVVLAGVYDIINPELKIHSEEEPRYNSPWNIAARFNLDMSFSADQIGRMLAEYEEDNRTGMDVPAVASCIYGYTSGYPYLVSAICKLLDEKLPETGGFENPAAVWTEEGIGEAVKILLSENIPLFDSMVKQLNLYQELREMTEEIVYRGTWIPYSPNVEVTSLGIMFGFLKMEDRHIVVANRIFEMVFRDMFIIQEAMSSEAYSSCCS